ncbi:MAG: serine--tRNA ligase [Bdellovibrionales bacterium]|nr:serine--tRNA ligase [Bdellovibrionales bacterium]
MLDWKRIVQDPAAFKLALTNRGFSVGDADQTLSKIQSVAASRVKIQQEADALKAERNKLSQSVAELMKKGDKASAQKMIEDGKVIGQKIEVLEKQLTEAESGFKSILDVVPNLPHSSVPVGKSAADNPVVREWGTKAKFSFSPKSHDELGEDLALLDFARASKISGARFTFVRGDLARLERALTSFMLDLHRPKGYEEIEPPYMVSAAAMYGTGQLPKFAEDVYKVEGQDKLLISTAEIPVTNFYADEIVGEEILPKKFMAFSPCFRSEAGSYGRDTKGLIRQHQFHKVEMVKFAHPDQSMAELEGMVNDAEEVLRQLEIPFRTVLLCSGDMGFSSLKTYDIEVWLPGSVTEGQGGESRGCYREISSCSNCGDFQARRANIRFKTKATKGTQHVHTLNGSGLAVGRTLIAVMENYQQADGSIVIPKVLRPYMGGQDVIRKQA